MGRAGRPRLIKSRCSLSVCRPENDGALPKIKNLTLPEAPRGIYFTSFYGKWGTRQSPNGGASPSLERKERNGGREEGKRHRHHACYLDAQRSPFGYIPLNREGEDLVPRGCVTPRGVSTVARACKMRRIARAVACLHTFPARKAGFPNPGKEGEEREIAHHGRK